MVPGDIIEWIYEGTHMKVGQNATLWSSKMKYWAMVGSQHTHVLVSINGEQITWMNDHGLFVARRGDTQQIHSIGFVTSSHPIVPRKKE